MTDRVPTTGTTAPSLVMRDATVVERAPDHDEKMITALELQVDRGADDLRAAVAELEAFAYNVSHDLRAPLRAISGFSEILVRDYGASLDARPSRLLDGILRNCRQMGDLIDDLLDFSRLSRKEMTTGPIDVGTLVASCVADLRQSDEGVVSEVTIDDLPACCGDAILIRQVFVNLLSNAFKYSAKSTPSRVHVGVAATTGNEVTYFVRDNGVGFDMAFADQLFEVFQRLHRAEDYAGTGIGLALSERIVKRHGGKIRGVSAPGEGATFYVTLPEAARGDDA